jgi:hypothetical protein
MPRAEARGASLEMKLFLPLFTDVVAPKASKGALGILAAILMIID